MFCPHAAHAQIMRVQIITLHTTPSLYNGDLTPWRQCPASGKIHEAAHRMTSDGCRTSMAHSHFLQGPLAIIYVHPSGEMSCHYLVNLCCLQLPKDFSWNHHNQHFAMPVNPIALDTSTYSALWSDMKGKILIKTISPCVVLITFFITMLPTHYSCEFWNYFRTITDSAHFSFDKPLSVQLASWLKNSQAGEIWVTWSLVLIGLSALVLPYAWECLQAIVTGAIIARQDLSITPHLSSMYSDHLCRGICTSQ